MPAAFLIGGGPPGIDEAVPQLGDPREIFRCQIPALGWIDLEVEELD
jgi:hypothetical protein